MTSTEERLSQLAEEHLGLGQPYDLDRGLADAGVPSVDMVAFLRVVAREFNLSITAGEWTEASTIRDLARIVDAHTG